MRLETPEQIVFLAAPSQAIMNRWYYFIQTQHILIPTHDMYLFNVQGRDSEFMNIIGAMGDCQLVLTAECRLMAIKLPKKEVLCIWPFDTLKTFSYGGGLFSFTSGRHSPHGPGDYAFITTQDKLIHDSLQKLIDKARRSSTISSGSSSHLSVSERPPAKLPSPGGLFMHNERDEDSSSDVITSSSEDNQAGGVALGGASNNIYTEADLSPFHPPPLPNQPPPKVPPKGLPGAAPGKAWLHDKYRSSASPEVDTTGKETGGDHLYSHTVHPGKVSSPVEDNPSIYNALVHNGKTASANYELAYPKPAQQVIQGTENYSFISQDLAKKPTKPVDVPPSAPPISPVGMTTNPLYGSSGNLLEAVESASSLSPSNKPLPPESIIDPLPSNNPLSEVQNVPQEEKPKPPTRPDVTANPTYITTTLKEPPPPPTAGNSQPTTTITTAVTEDDDSKPPPIREYSKVSKPVPFPEVSEGSDNIPGSLGSDMIASSVSSDPPPIPEREYSFSDCDNTN